MLPVAVDHKLGQHLILQLQWFSFIWGGGGGGTCNKMKVMQVVHLGCARGREREEVREGEEGGGERGRKEEREGERGGGGRGREGGGERGEGEGEREGEREDERPNIGILVYVMIDTRR